MLPSHRATNSEDVESVSSRRTGAPLLQLKRPKGGDQQPTGLIILTAACCLLLIVQLWFNNTGPRRTWSDAADIFGRSHRRDLAAAGRADDSVGLAMRTFPAPHLKNLVLVACHSVYTGLDFHEAEEKSSWFLLDYQKDVPGQTHSFVDHIQLGVREAAADPEALLLFSGGKTRRDAGPRAEGEGYWLVAEAAGWYGSPAVRDRAFTEDRARDSFENLLFGLCRFYELTGHYPEFIIAVGYDFKARRFSELHRAALRLPAEGWRYEGTPALNAAALKGEEATLAAFAADPYGCSAELAAKRQQRDPFDVGGYSGERCPDMAGLLRHCGPEVYDGPLPWDP